MDNPKEYYSIVTNVDIAEITKEILSDRITEETGDVIYINCPRHDSQSKRSFTVDKNKQCWYCFGCGEGGDVLHLVEFVQSGNVTKNVSGCMPDSHRAARDYLAKKAGVTPLSHWNLSPEQIADIESRRSEEDLVFGILTDIAYFYHEKLVGDKKALEALQDQYGISTETIQTLKIGYADNEGLVKHLKQTLKHEPADIAKTGCFNFDYHENMHPVFKNRFIFPYWKRGKVVYLIGRRTQWTENTRFENPKYKKLPLQNDQRKYVSPCISNRYFYNEDSVFSSSDFIIITEGVTDCISLMENGFACLSPVTTKFSDADKEKLFRLTNRFSRIYVCQDNEPSEAGFKGAMSTAHFLDSRGARVFVISLPLGEKQNAARKQLEENPNSDQKTIDQLKAASKIDVNEYFKTHTTDDFTRLLETAQSPIEYAIHAVPADSPVKERNIALEPVLKKIAQKSSLEQDAYLDEIRNHFTTKISKTSLRETIKKYKSAGVFDGEDQTPTLRELADDIIEHAGPFCFASNTGWFQYRDGVWNHVPTDHINHIVDQRLDDKFKNDNTTKKLRDEVREKVAIHSKVLLPVEVVLNGYRNLLNLKNGMYDVVSGKLSEHDAKYLSTIQLPYEYNSKSKCPRWNQFLEEIFPDDPDSKNILQEWYGYCLIPETKYEKALFCVGEGCNGKTVALTVLENLIGKANCSHISLDKLDADFHTVGLFNKLLNLCKETEAREIANSAAFKSVVSGETQEDAYKFRDRFSFPVFARLCFATNNFPKFNDTSQGIYRRLLVLYFKESFEGKEDTDLLEKLLMELPGIFQWALDGYRRLEARGRFEIPLEMLQAIEDLKRHSSSVASFVSECCEWDPESEDEQFITNREVYGEYKDFCRENGFKAYASNTFSKELRRLLPECKSEKRWWNGGTVKGFLGLKLK